MDQKDEVVEKPKAVKLQPFSKSFEFEKASFSYQDGEENGNGDSRTVLNEIDLQVKTAERDLVKQAANLAVDLAGKRIKQTINDDDQRRLVDRYLSQVKK
jgi:hypothetical protein